MSRHVSAFFRRVYRIYRRWGLCKQDSYPVISQGWRPPGLDRLESRTERSPSGPQIRLRRGNLRRGSVFLNPNIDTVVIATRHDSHSALVCEALKAKKHVFVEKPLALTLEQLDEIEETWRSLPEPRHLMVGFNRRFAPHVLRMRELLKGIAEPKAFVYVVNAGSIPAGHWTQDLERGGGRIAGEACHFIDLLRHLAGCPAKSVCATRQSSDTVTISIAYEDGSIGTVHYFATGHKSMPKERLEVFVGGRVLVLDNFRKLKGYGWPGFSHLNLWRQDKGANRMADAFVQTIRRGGPPPIPFDELIEVSRATLKSASC